MATRTQLPKTATISERVADYVVGLRYEDLPSAVVAKTKDLLVFHLGVALLGREMRRGRQGVDAALNLGGVGDCSIVGDRRRGGPLDAVLANSSLMTSAGLIDRLTPSGVKPGVVVYPAALAIGEAANASGRELLTSVVVGYNVMAKLHNGELSYELAVPRPTIGVIEPFGVAATAARLLGLSHEHTVHALGHTGQSVMGLYVGIEHQWLMHPLAARNGVQAALLANAELPASPTIIEDPHGVYRSFFLQDVPDSVYDNLATLGEDFEIARAWTTRYPVSAVNIHPIELTQQLVAQHALTADRVASVDVVLPPSREAREAIYGTYPQGPSTLIAIVLIDGHLHPARFEESFDADVLAMRDRVRLRFEDGHDFFYARVEVATTDGQHHTAEAAGYPDPPSIEWDDWLASGDHTTLTDGQLTRLADLIRHLEDVTDVSELMDCVRPVDTT